MVLSVPLKTCKKTSTYGFLGVPPLRVPEKIEAYRLPWKRYTVRLRMSLPPPIKVPIFEEQRCFRIHKKPIKPKYYANWTPSDYARVFSDANTTPYTWNDVIVRMRRPRRVKMPQDGSK